MVEENDKLLEEIELYLQYAVLKQEQKEAFSLVRSYRENRRVMRLLREYYMSLPEAREEAVCKLAALKSEQGVTLFVVVSNAHAYLYIVSDEELVYLCEYRQEVPTEVLSYFGYATQADFLKDCPETDKLEPFPAESYTELAVCTACGVAEGEEHLLGCIGEICPWCEGTLNNCNCRFEQLKVDEIETEEQLETFTDMLTAKGRIPFRKEEKVAYPGTSKGLDRRKKRK